MSGVASAKNLLPSSAVPASTTVPTTSSTVPGPRAQKAQPQGAYVPGFDIAAPREQRRKSSTVSTASSTIPGAPQY